MQTHLASRAYPAAGLERVLHRLRVVHRGLSLSGSLKYYFSRKFLCSYLAKYISLGIFPGYRQLRSALFRCFKTA